MRDSRPSLYAYIITSLCVVVFTAFGWEQMVIVAIPVIIPAIFFYYTQTATRSISILFSIALWLFFVADMIELVDEDNGIYLIIFCTALSYLLLLHFALQDKIKLVFSFKTISITALFTMLASLLCIAIIEKTANFGDIYFYVFVLYAIIILSIFSYAMLRMFSKKDIVSQIFLTMVVLMFISDILYGYKRYIEFSTTVIVVSNILQFISYYLMVEYFNKRSQIIPRASII